MPAAQGQLSAGPDETPPKERTPGPARSIRKCLIYSSFTPRCPMPPGHVHRLPRHDLHGTGQTLNQIDLISSRMNGVYD